MTDKGTQFGILHWGPCVVHTKLQKPILDKLYVAAISSQKSANEELAGVLKEQIHIKDKEQFGDFFNSMFTLYNHALKQWRKDLKQDPKYFLEKLSIRDIDIPLFKKASSLILFSRIFELNFIVFIICVIFCNKSI